MADDDVKKSNKSALVIIPPEEVWDQIQSIRSKHDKSYKRWMPHINLLYPFINDDKKGENFEFCKNEISSTIEKEDFKSFTVKFDANSFQHFKHKNNCTLWLKPLKECQTDDEKHEDIMKIQSLLEVTFPEYDDLSNIPPDYQFTPHLSLGQFAFNEIEDMKKSFKDKWKEVEFNVKNVYIISRRNFDSPFEIRHSVALK